MADSTRTSSSTVLKPTIDGVAVERDSALSEDGRRGTVAPRRTVDMAKTHTCVDCRSYIAGPATPYRPFYIAARTAVVVLGAMLFALSFVAEFVIHRGKWMNPIMTPSLTAAIYSAFDLVCVCCYGRRTHPHTRLLYDGLCLGTGHAIAAGFLTSFMVPDFHRTAPDATSRSAGVAAAILFGMYSIMVLQYGIGINGLRQTLQLRHGKVSGSA